MPPPRAVTERAPPPARTVEQPRENFELEPKLVQSFRSDGKLVRVEVIRAQNAGPMRPAVIMLHGASGLGSGWLGYPYGEELARRGIDAFVVRYYDGLDANDGAKSSSDLHYRREQIISDAISFVAARADIDPNRIGVYGMSLGAFHALALGTHDSRVSAIADVMGAMPGQIALGSVTSMPPTLLIHGARDRIVPIERMYDVASMLDQIGTPYEVKVYTDQAHNLTGPAHTDSILTVADFFDRQLNGASLTASAAVPSSSRTLTSIAEIQPVIAKRTVSSRKSKDAKSSKVASKEQRGNVKGAAKVPAKTHAKAIAGKESAKSTTVAKATSNPTAATRTASKAKAGGIQKEVRTASKATPAKAKISPTSRAPVDRNQLAATR